MECKKEKNLDKCNCTYEPCSRKGVCCDCLTYHLKSRELPACCFPKEAEKTYHLIIEARELTWIRIKADHNQSSQMILKPGQKIERFASDRFVVDVGNAAGIDVTFQGRSMGNLGEQGQVVHLTLP